MKKFLTLRNIVLAAGALVAIVGFVLTFFAGLKLNLGVEAEIKSFIYGAKTLVAEGEEYAVKDVLGYEPVIAIVPFIGALLMVVGAVAACVVGLLVKKPFAKWIVLACGVVVLAGGIMQFFPVEAFTQSYVDGIIKADPSAADYRQELIDEMLEQLKAMEASSPMAIVCGVLGCVGGAAAGASAFLGKKGE